ncbi:MAG: nucleotide exchange factor GrpE [Hyphococcus sp.]
MNDQKYPHNEGQDGGPHASQADDQDAPAQPNPHAAPAEGESAQELADLKDRFLRLAAELENTRRRAEREKADASRYAIASFARDLLGVSDNFERALRAAGVSGDDIPEERSDAFKGLVSGIQMTEKELLSVLERHGVQRITPAGEKFDPNLHQAVAQVPSADIPSGHVVDVAQPGFTIGERVLRAAMVTVSSGAAPSANGAENGAGSEA